MIQAKNEVRLLDDSINSNMMNLPENTLEKSDIYHRAFFNKILLRLIHFRVLRAEFLYELSITRGAFNWIDIENPLIFLRAFWLMITAEILLDILAVERSK